MAENSKKLTSADITLEEALVAKDAFYVLDPSGRNLEWVCVYDGPFKTNADYLAQEWVEGCPSYEERWAIRRHPNCSFQGSWFQLMPHLREWLDEKGYRYQIDYRYCGIRLGWHVGFLDPKAAMLFKLTWGLGATTL